MSTVVMHNVVSVDGYIADENDEVGPLFDWYFNGDHPLVAGEMDEPAPGGMRISKASYDYIRPTWDGIGSMVIGRHLFDMTNAGRAGHRRGSTWSWCRTGPSRTGGTRRRRTTSSTMSRRPSRRRRSSPGSAPWR